MPAINRENVDDAKKVVDRLVPDGIIQDSILAFLSDAIIYANSIRPDNWNLNLDKNGTFIRFNVGQEYCIQVDSKSTLVLALKEYLPIELIEDRSVNFVGYVKRKKILSNNFWEIPDCLGKIPGSVGCNLKNERTISQTLSLITETNRRFIEEALAHTEIRPLMIHAHSPAFIAYLSHQCDKWIADPSYEKEDKSPNIFPSPLEDLENYQISYEGLQGTERQAVIQSRIGQGKFRTNLIEHWGKCAVTGCQKVEILRASHIKPWRKANNRERLDVYNGLLLVPNLDAAFDTGVISFADDGHILISRSLCQDDRDKLGIDTDLCISSLTEKHIHYLRYHRKHIFKD